MSRRRSDRRFCNRGPLAGAVIALAFVAADPALHSQDQPSQPSFRVEANYVRVDVYATRDGVPVNDLRSDDFELFEDKAAQRIDQFSHVQISAAGPSDTRSDPATVDQARQAMDEARARVFVLFLDAMHVDRQASQKIRKPLVESLDRLIAPDDLVAVMTPGMSARDLTFGRRTATVDRILSRYWGGRDQLTFDDPVEQQYASCYPGIPERPDTVAPDRGIAQEMILRRREKQTLDALEDLVTSLRGLREERKAVITISNGWRLYGPSQELARPISNAVPTGPQVMVDPRSGRLTTGAPQGARGQRPLVCERDRLELSRLDDAPRFRQILDEANRANASFYPVDPRGLVVFDDDIVPAAGVGAGPAANPTINGIEDQARLTARHTSLRTMADATDGRAIVETSDLAAGLRRIADDLNSYYLLGYYSTGKLDGKFHAINVRIKRPGITVRARRGYLAVNAASAATLTRSNVVAPLPAESGAAGAAVAALGATARDAPMRVQAAAAWTNADGAVVWAVAERGRTAGGDDWAGGGSADVMIVDRSGATVGAGHSAIDPGATSVRVKVTARTIAAGEYEVRVRTIGAGRSAATNESVVLTLPSSPAGVGVMFFRRGPTTGNKDVGTTDVRFRRSDRLRVDLPVQSSENAGARLLDRSGKPLPIPVTTSTVDDPDGSRWQTAQVALAPLAPGDYILELTSGPPSAQALTLAAFRVVP